MKRLKLAALTFAIAAALCALIYLVADRVYGTAAGPELSLWYLRSDAAGDALNKLGLSYNTKARGEARLTLRSFDSEEELAAALDTEVPDMLLCSYVKAADLGSRGLLSEAETEDISFPEAVTAVMPGAGSCFYPLGSRVTVLIRSRALCADIPEPDSLETLAEQCAEYTERTGQPFISAQSWAELINVQMCSLGAEFSGLLDAGDGDFKRVYNTLASLGYGYSLTTAGDGCAEKVTAGELACAFVPSTSLSTLSGKKVSVMAPPLPEEGEALCPAELMGIAVTGGHSQRLPSAADFLNWLYRSGGDRTLALASAMIPVSEGKSGSGFWAQPLAALAAQRQLVYMAPDSGYFASRAGFDAAFTKAIDLLQ